MAARWADAAAVTVVRGGALGDFIVTLPAVRALVTPGRALRLVGNARVARALAPELFCEINSIDEGRWGWLFDEGLPPEVVPEAAVVLLRASGTAERMRRHGWAPVLASSSYPPIGTETHVADHLLAAVAPVLAETVAASDQRSLVLPRMAVGAEARAAARRALAALGVIGTREAYAVVHPGSGSPWKCWPVARFGAIVAALAGCGLACVVLAGPADREPLAALRAVTARRLAILENAPLEVVAGLLAAAALYVGNDSGVSHLAAAVGAPTLALFGPTRAARWAPRGTCVAVLEPSTRCSLCAAAEELPARCRCIEQIAVDEVLAATNRLLAS